ncbi:hypothetical protein Hanom_Chr15g01341141 [Helianthus anomalus]
MMDRLTTCCTFAGVSGLSGVEVTPRQSAAYVALTGDCHWCYLHCVSVPLVERTGCGVSRIAACGNF